MSSKSCVNADSLLIRAAATSTSGTLNDLTTDLIMANNNNRYCSPFLPMFLRCLMLMLSGPVELLFLLFLIAARTCSVVVFICVGCRLSTFLVIFLFVVLVL